MPKFVKIKTLFNTELSNTLINSGINPPITSYDEQELIINIHSIAFIYKDENNKAVIAFSAKEDDILYTTIDYDNFKKYLKSITND